jgi:hypothetical protein
MNSIEAVSEVELLALWRDGDAAPAGPGRMARSRLSGGGTRFSE